jgi:hypothetical protein
MVMPRTGNGVVQIALRLPEQLRDQIKHVATQNGRSINSEIIARIEQSFEQDEADYVSMPMSQFRRTLEIALRTVMDDFQKEADRKTEAKTEKGPDNAD